MILTSGAFDTCRSRPTGLTTIKLADALTTTKVAGEEETQRAAPKVDRDRPGDREPSTETVIDLDKCQPIT